MIEKEKFSDRERLVLARLADGRIGKEIAEELGLKSEQVFKNRFVRLRQRLGATNTAHAVSIALRRGIIQ